MIARRHRPTRPSYKPTGANERVARTASTDRERWNERYRQGAYDFTPADWLVQRRDLLRPRQPDARGLDMACGAGRNALYLAELGYRVDAWDISDVALDLLRGELDRRRDAGQPLALMPRRVDLETAALPVSIYDLVLDANFLDRSLFPAMAAALRRDGLLVIHTLMRRAEREDRNPDYLLEPGELRTAFAGLDVLEHEEDRVVGWVRLVARRSGTTQPA